jgi:hypothetical protein
VDIRVALAREKNRLARAFGQQADLCREQRDRLICELRDEDPEKWTYTALASGVGISPELVAKIIRTRPDQQAGRR